MNDKDNEPNEPDTPDPDETPNAGEPDAAQPDAAQPDAAQPETETPSETETAATPQPPVLPARSGSEVTEVSTGYEAMEQSPGLATVVDALLKSPTRLLYECQEGRRGPVIRNLTIVSVVSFLLFGFLLGLFSGGDQLWAVPVKVFAGALISGLITLPSLYVFSSLGGLDMTLPKAGGLMLSGLALIGVILLGLAPVLWIFTQSTDSIGFMGFLVLTFWLASCGFGLALIRRNARVFGRGGAGYLVLWAAIFLLVTLQMSTSLRPLLGPTAETLLPTEKRFFLEHWATVLTGTEE